MKKMNIWFVCIGEPVPTDKDLRNLHRCGQFALEFSKSGNKVNWITSNFDHFSKEKLEVESEMKISENFTISFLDTKPYKKNISLSRFHSHYLIGNEFKKKIKNFSSNHPDIIYASFPTIELAYECTKYAVKNRIPIVVDVRDLWPDIFLSAVPNFLHFIAKIALFSWYRKKSYIFKNATSIIAISNGCLEFANQNIDRKDNKNDKIVYKSYFPNQSVQKSKSDKFKAIYVGAISKNKTSLKSVIEVFNDLDSRYELIICGDGDDINYYKSIANDNIIFKGWVSKSDINNIISDCSLGLVPLKNRFDFNRAIVNKAIEYISYGIPVITSLKGDLKDFVEANNVGLFYANKKELRKSILKLDQDRDFLELLSRNASKTFSNYFDFTKNFSKLQNHFASLIK
jgi:glycosyltransferase involved in cell wall biosynthesis